MNAAARAIHQSNLFMGNFSEIAVSTGLKALFLLLVIFLLSSLGIIYITNEYRSSFDSLQQLQQESQSLRLQYSQLLLEQASWATPGRVEALATEKLNMHFPTENDILILQQHDD